MLLDKVFPGDTINVELQEQNAMLDETNEEMDTVMGRIKHLTDKLDRLIQDSMWKKVGIVILLLTVLIIMIYFLCLYIGGEKSFKNSFLSRFLWI